MLPHARLYNCGQTSYIPANAANSKCSGILMVTVEAELPHRFILFVL